MTIIIGRRQSTPKAIIVYESIKERTEVLARRIEEGMKESGVEVVMKRAGSAKANDRAI